jgi:hypothetical protein
MVVPTATPEIILHKQTNNYGQIGYKGVLVESSCASGRTLPDLCRRPIFRTPDCMLLVALGLYSASYKAFMALRLKPLVPFLKFVALILFVNCSRSGLNVGLPAQIASYQTHLRQNNTVRTASYIDEPLEQLLQAIPEIKTLQPAQDQMQLAMILEHSGKNVDMEFNN